MSETVDPSTLDAADIDVTAPPAGWRPAVTDDHPDEVDVRDLDEDADA